MARYLVTFLPGNPISTRTKYIDDAVGPPDADVDWGTDGVSFGSILWDGTDLWFCVDPTTAAAVWVQINGGGASDLTTKVEDFSVSGANDVDRNAGATHDLTLTGNATLSPIHSDPPTGDAIDLRVRARQDGVGGHTLTIGGTLDWATPGAVAPTIPTDPNAFIDLGFLSLDDAVSWTGYVVDTSPVVLELEDLTDVDLTSPTEGDNLRYRSGEWVNEVLTIPPGLLTVDAGAPTYDDSGDDVVITLASKWGHDGEPYFDDTGAATGEEAILAMDPTTGELVVVPYQP